jgi:hypothetical protein
MVDKATEDLSIFLSPSVPMKSTIQRTRSSLRKPVSINAKTRAA